MNFRSKIQIKEKLCKCGCGNSGRIFSKGLVLSCWKREYAKNKIQKERKPINKFSEKRKAGLEFKKSETEKLHKWFLDIWDMTEDASGYCFCYETHEPMHRSIYRDNSCCYHHLLEKSKYPQYALEEWNLVIVLPRIHSQVHSNIDKTPRIKILTTELQTSWQ
jgi:hypothetical protein